MTAGEGTATIEAERPELVGRAPRSLRSTLVSAGKKTLTLIAALFLFVGALQVMKTGAGGLELLKDGGPLVHNGASTLGLGWLGALLVLSGSPIAASSLTLVAGGSLSENEGFWMVAGSRLGAAFVVLLVGVVFALRGGKGKRSRPVATGIIALVVTACMYIPGAAIGGFLLQTDSFQRVNIDLPTGFSGLIDAVYGGLLGRIEHLPGLVLFAAGLALLVLAMKVLDRVIPEIDDQVANSARAEWLRRKWPMFLLGCLVALVTMSVSMALTVLVPLVARNYVTRKEIIPYVMGANITTLGDTLLAALILNSAAATRIVIANIAGATVVALILLMFFYEPLWQAIKKTQMFVLNSHARLAGFTAALFLFPLSLLLTSRFFG